MSTRNADVGIRYLIDVIDKGLAKALVLTKDMGTASKETGKQVELSADLQKKQWAAVERVATQADVKIVQSAITRSTEINKALDKEIAKQRDLGASYSSIITKQREMGTSAAELAASVERNAAREIKAITAVRLEAEKPVHRRSPISSAESSAAGRGRGVLRGAGTAIGIAGIGGFIGAEAVNSAVEATVARARAAQTLAVAGISRTQAQALSAGAQALDVPQATLSTGIKTLAQKSTAALRPGATEKQAQPFIDLGLSKSTLQKDAGNTSKLLGDVANKLEHATKGSKTYAAGTALLGKGFAALHPLLEDGSKGLQRNTQLAEKYGLITKGPAAKGIKELHDKQVELKFATMGLQTSIATNLTPILLKVLPVFASLVRTLSTGLKPAITAIGKVLGPVVKFFKDGSTTSKVLAAAIVALVTAFTGFKILQSITKAWVAFDAAMAANPVGLIIVAIAALAAGLIYAYTHSKKFRDIVDKIGSICKSVGKSIISGLGAAVDWITTAFHNSVDFLKGIPGDFRTAGHKIADAFTGAFKSVKGFLVGIFKDEINGVITILNTGLRLMNKVLGPHKLNLGITTIHTPDLRIPLIPHFQDGGLLPAMVSPGEVLISPNGHASMVPGARVAADNTFAMMAPGTAVLTGHGQALMAAGMTLPDALNSQLPHFGPGTDSLGYTLGPTKKPKAPKTAHKKKDTGPHDYGKFLSTAYGPPWGGIEGGGITATGVNLSAGPARYIVAVDPSVIPLHTKLQINPNPFGSRNIVFQAEDTGGAIKGHRIDFYDWMGRAHQNKWGRRQVDARYPGAGTSATSAPKAAAIKVPGLSSKDIASPVDSFEAGYQAGLAGDSLTGLTTQAIKDIAVTLTAPTKAAVSAGVRTSSTLLGGRIPGHPELKTKVSQAGQAVLSRFKGLGVSSTTGGNHVANSYHYKGQAVDIAGAPALMNRAASWVHTSGLYHKLLEGIHNPNLAVKNGRLVSGPGVYGAVWPGHKDHIHLAARRGGVMPHFRFGSPGAFAVPSLGSLSGTHGTAVIGRDLGTLTSSPVGTVDGSIGKAIRSIGHWLDAANSVTDSRLGSLASSLQKQIATLKKRKAPDIVIRRLQSALNLVEGEVGLRIGKMVKAVDDAQTKMQTQVTAFGRFQRLQAIDPNNPIAPDSAAGLQQQAGEQGLIATGLRSNITQLNSALAVAKKHKDTKAIDDITARLDKAQDDLQEAIVTGLEAQAAAVQKVKQDAMDAAHNAESIAAGQTGLDQSKEAGFEIQQQLAGTFNTPGGAQARADNIRNSIIPDLQNELTKINDAYTADKANGADPAVLLQDLVDAQNKTNEIGQANLDANQQTATNTDALKDFTGATGFEFQGQQETDLLGLGVGV